MEAEKINLKELKEVYLTTLNQSEKTSLNVIQIPFKNYYDLVLFKENMIKALDLVVSDEAIKYHSEQLPFIVKSITRVLQSISLNSECEGLSKLE